LISLVTVTVPYTGSGNTSRLGIYPRRGMGYPPLLAMGFAVGIDASASRLPF
jgi:hypothetical protein